MVTREAAMDLFDRRRRAWLDEDLDAYLAFFADDIHFEMPRRDPIDGIDDYSALVRRSLEAVRPVSFDFHALAVEDDSVLAEWTIALEVRAGGRCISYRGMSAC